jgi:hypothetical protein
MVHPQVKLKEEPPIWRVAVNILLSSQVQPTKGGPPAWGLDEVLTTPYRKNGLVTCAQACTDPLV